MQDSTQPAGLIPESGLITAEELAKRLGLIHVGNLKTEMQRKGISHVSISGKRLYRCADIVGLFIDQFVTVGGQGHDWK